MPLSSPRVAIVIPCYNDGATVRETVESVLADPEKAELVVIDDGSSDEATLAVLDTLRSDGTRVLRQENSGLSAARMAGVRATTAPYVLNLDSDDKLIPGRIGALADALDADPDIAFAYGDVQQFGDVNRLIISADWSDPWRDSLFDDLPAVAMFRRSTLERSGGWTFSRGFEDWDLWMTLGEQGFYGRRIPGAVHLYRQHGLRMLGRARHEHAALYAELLARHPHLVARRSALRRDSRAPWLVRQLCPLIELLPVSRWQKSLWHVRINHLACRRPLMPAIAAKHHREHPGAL